MCNNTDPAQAIRALDIALLEQARRWRSFLSNCDGADDSSGVAWTEEFCLLVRNRLAKLQGQQILEQVCWRSGAPAVRHGLRRTAGKVVSRRVQHVQST